MGYFHAGPTWMRNGTQGHVAAPRETHMDATWHARPRSSATRAHAAPTRRDVTCYLYIYIYRNYMGYSTYKHSVVRIYANPYNQRTLYTRHLHLISPAWDQFSRSLSVQDTWLKVRRRIKWSTNWHAWIAWTRGPLIIINACGF